MEIVTTASYLVLINGQPKGFITQSRGIRQEYPLSPYLFLLCAEGLSALLQKTLEDRVLIGIQSSQHGVCISHLLFADDSLLFCNATVGECQHLMQILSQYEEATGQAINHQKTSLFFSKNTKPQVRGMIQQMLGARIMTQCDRYLGLPMAIGNSKVNTFKDLQEKITKCVMGWKEKFISKVGHENLIKTVAQAISTYSMSLFKLPRSLCGNINSLVAKYWWGQHQDERKIHWINWKKLCTQKKNGGMGFRDLHSFNIAMLSKQAWRSIEDTHSLFYKVYKARYFPNGSFMTAEVGSNPSFVWRSLLAARDILVAGSYWRVGVRDGRTIGVFTHKWLSHAPIPLNVVSYKLWVCDLIDEDTRQWDRGKLQAIFTDRTRQEILNIPLTNLHSKDTLV